MSNKQRKRQLCALIFNIEIVILECIGFYLSISKYGNLFFRFYTESCNILTLVSSTLFVIFTLCSITSNDNKLSKWIKRLRYISTVSLSLTFLVVFSTILPITNKDFSNVMLSGSFIFHHTLCPILSVISFVFLEDFSSFTRRDMFIACSFTYFYALIVIALNAFKIIRGPYYFLHIYEQPISLTVSYFLIIIVAVYLISKFLLAFNKNISSRYTLY